MLCLDTNVVIAILNGRDPKVTGQLHAALSKRTSIHIPMIVWFELRYGAEKSQARARNIERLDDFMLAMKGIVPFEKQDAEHAADIRAQLEMSGIPIGPYDILIAAQARRLAATLVTANGREFSRINGLNVINWAE